MDGVFIKKFLRRILICIVVWVFFQGFNILSDRYLLDQNLIRFHVVANSDSAEDQKIKQQVKDAVLQSIQKDLQAVSDIDAAKRYLKDNLPKIDYIAHETLEQLGAADHATVKLCKEKFNTRIYDTFTLPAGFYESLCITIGSGEGKNWWCVVFPALCIPTTVETFADSAINAGFSNSLVNTLSEPSAYRIRFFLLDTLGSLTCKFNEES